MKSIIYPVHEIVILSLHLLTDVDIYCAHPGVVHTEMNRHLPTVLDTIYKLAFRPFLKVRNQCTVISEHLK